MAHRLNTNKQFMVGNGILAFAVIFVVVLFVYMSLRLQREKQDARYFPESYRVELVRGFAGDSLSILLNDSLIATLRMDSVAHSLEFGRFAEQSTLLIVDHDTDQLSAFELSEKGGTYRLEKDAEGIKLRAH